MCLYDLCSLILIEPQINQIQGPNEETGHLRSIYLSVVECILKGARFKLAKLRSPYCGHFQLPVELWLFSRIGDCLI